MLSVRDREHAMLIQTALPGKPTGSLPRPLNLETHLLVVSQIGFAIMQVVRRGSDHVNLGCFPCGQQGP